MLENRNRLSLFNRGDETVIIVIADVGKGVTWGFLR